VKDDSTSIDRRRFLISGAQGTLAVAGLSPALFAAAGLRAEAPPSAADIVVNDPEGVLGHAQAPVIATVRLGESRQRAAREGRLQVRELDVPAAKPPEPVAAQLLSSPGTDQTNLCWIMPPGQAGLRRFRVEEVIQPAPANLQAGPEASSGQFSIADRGQAVLRYNYHIVEPGDLLTAVAPGNRIYARARSNYLHPLYGLNGETLTKDWSLDHPHHRGVYWAWPEVDWHGQRGDLHALQTVFARPTGKCAATSGSVFALLEAENLWQWEDHEPIVRELALIRAWRANGIGRYIDLDFHFTALKDDVAIARRETSHYGGLNIRLAQVREQQIVQFTSPPSQTPRMAWAALWGTFPGGKEPAGLAVLQSPKNPDYPGEWVKYPELNWLQPTFPAAGTRYVLKAGQPLRLQFRLWILPGRLDEKTLSDGWSAYAAAPPIQRAI
jgi:hypothetical protein